MSRSAGGSKETSNTGVLRAGAALDSDEAIAAATAGFRQMVAYFARRADAAALQAPISPEAQLAEQVATVLALAAARGKAADKKMLREAYEAIFSVEFRRGLVLAAVAHAVEQLEAGTLPLDDAWRILLAKLVALDDAFMRVPDALKNVLNKTRQRAKGAGVFSTAKAAAALSLAAGAFGDAAKKGERLGAARARVAKSFRQAVRERK